MNDSFSENSRSRVEQLAAKMLDGNLSAAEQAELLRAIDQHAEACDQFVRHVAMHAYSIRKQILVHVRKMKLLGRILAGAGCTGHGTDDYRISFDKLKKQAGSGSKKCPIIIVVSCQWI